MRKFTLGVILFTLIFLVVLALNLYPGLRGGAGWDWPYTLPQNWGAVVALALVLIAYTAISLFLLRRNIRPVLTLLWAILGGTVLAYAVVGIQGDPFFHLFTRTVSPVQTGASALSVRIMAQDGLDTTLARWPEVMRSALDANLIHFTTSPPGQPLIHYALAKFFDAPVFAGFSEPASQILRAFQCSDYEIMRATRGEIISAGLGLLMPFFAALAAVPIFSAARDLTDDARLGLRAAVWWPLVPSILMFAPTWNTLYPALCVLAFAFLVRALTRSQNVYAFASGLVMSVTTFLNFSVLPVFLLFGLFTLGYCIFIGVRGARYISPLQNTNSLIAGFRRAVIVGLWFGGGLLVIWTLFFLASGLTPLDLLRVTFEKHGELVQRDYLPWLILHPYDVLLFVGWPLAALALFGIWRTVRAVIRRERGLILTSFDVLALSMGLTFVLVNLAGIVQGENARILAFYAPFLVIIGVGAASVSPPVTPTSHQFEKNDSGVIALFLTQALAVLVMASVLPVVPLDLNPQPTGPRQDIGGIGDGFAFVDSGAVFTSAAYSGEFKLARYRYVADPGAMAITYEFEWEGLSPTERPYHFELITGAENSTDGQIVSEPFRWLAQGGNYLPTCWKTGETIRDTVVIPLPPVSEPVVWEVTLRAVDERTGITTPTAALEPVRYP